jgi:cytochrome c oxidase subunit 2
MTPRNFLLRAARRLPSAVVALTFVLALAGCGGNQNTLDPASHAEHRISNLFWVLFVASSIGFGLVVWLLFLGWWRRNRPDLPRGVGEHGATGLVIGLGIALPIVLLSILFVWSDVFVIRSTAAPAKGTTAMTVVVTGRQWWWQVSYQGSTAVTANEIHIPVNTRVRILARTTDVIHSFWIPELNRKIDMIPGRTGSILLDATRPGTYRGQCSEFCGLQHAHMTVEVIAESRPAFNRWLAANAGPAHTPSGAAAAGLTTFMGSGCGDCHQIRGTSAHGLVGPDLTHLEGRQTLAAATIANTPQNLADWIRHPQQLKPGSKMPDLQLPDADWSSSVSYLRTLR